MDGLISGLGWHLKPGVLKSGILRYFILTNVELRCCQIPHPQGQYFWSIDVNSLCWPGGGGGGGGGFN